MNFGILIWGGPLLWYSQILSNFIFSYLPILKIFISPGWVVQFWILASLFEGDPFILVPPNVVKFYLIFILSFPKISSVQRKWLNFEFWRPCLKRIPSFWYPQTLSNFIFSWYLHILKISCAQHEWLKSSNFGRPVWGVPPILIRPNFVKFYLFFIFANAKNFMCLACVVRKFDFWRPHLRGTPQFGTPNCFKFYVPFKFTYLKNFMWPALKVKKFEFWRSRLGVTPNFGTHNFCLV